MTPRAAGAVLPALAIAAAILLAAPAPCAADVVIDHVPVSCVPVDRYARIAARASGPVGRAELQFRTHAGSDWYSVRMAEQGGEWSADLPRPTSALAQLEYRIVMTAPDAASVATAPATARVAADCDPVPASSLEASIVVTVPSGAPVVPPVPAGFSPAGVVAAAGDTGLSRSMKIAGAAAGAAVLGATTAAVAGSSTSGPRNERPEVPGFRFNSISPPPGSVVSRLRDRLAVSVLMAYEPGFPLHLSWGVTLRSSGAGRDCLVMSGRTTAQQPLELTLTGILVTTAGGGCGAEYETDTVRITIAYQDQLAYDETLALPYRFQP